MQKAIAEGGDLIGPTYNTQYVDQSTGETKTQKEPAQNGAVLIENKQVVFLVSSQVVTLKPTKWTTRSQHTALLVQPSNQSWCTRQRLKTT